MFSVYLSTTERLAIVDSARGTATTALFGQLGLRV